MFDRSVGLRHAGSSWNAHLWVSRVLAWILVLHEQRPLTADRDGGEAVPPSLSQVTSPSEFFRDFI